MLTYHLDPQSKTPLYEQLYRAIRADIMSGALAGGARLPSKRKLAANLRRLEKGKKLRPFRYRNLGSMATVGRNKAVCEFSSVKMAGFVAWVMWLVVHLRSILGVRNKVFVMLNWVWNYFNYNQSLRMIFYPRKAKEILEREAREATAHWGEDLKWDE